MSAAGIQNLALKVLELHRAGIESLDSLTSGPTGQGEFSGKASKFERSPHTRVFNLQHSIKSISGIMSGDVEELSKQITARHEDLHQKSILLDVCLAKIDDQTAALNSKIYTNLNELELSPALKEQAQQAVMNQEAKLAAIINEERAARESALAHLTSLQEQLKDLTDQLQQGILADTNRIDTLSNLYSKLQSECLDNI